jgi:DNA polymerase-3 subunit gamma/tau
VIRSGSAAAIREVWPEIIAVVGRQSKKIAALASGATVRDLDGRTVVLTFRFPAHAKMVAAEPDLITNALYEALGGRWQIRSEVSGEAGGVQPAAAASPRRSGTQQTPTQGPSNQGTNPGTANQGALARGRSARAAEGTTPARQREAAESASSATHTPDDDDWPEPARPGGLAAPAGGRDTQPDDSWAADGPSSSDSRSHGASESLRSGGGIGGSGLGGATEGPGSGGTGGGPGSSGVSSDLGSGGGGLGSAGSGGPRSGIGAARAAAAGARNGAAKQGASPGAAGPPPHPATPRSGPAPSDTWSDGSSAEEAPYDPDYDGPVGPGAAASYEGFDPGDEPLDDVIDEKTARQSSEQQAMQLLQDALGAEKIGES